MEDLDKYTEWLRMRGVENPSEDQVKDFGRKANNNLRGSLLEFIVITWLDRRWRYSGTREWLKREGLLNPSERDLGYFGRKIRNTVLWRASILLVFITGWFVFLRAIGLPPKGFQLVPPISGLVYGLANSFGTQLPRGSAARAEKKLVSG